MVTMNDLKDAIKAETSVDKDNEPLTRFLEITEKYDHIIQIIDKLMKKIFKDIDFPTRYLTVVEA